ncbi:MAG: EAL domain-containing protein [Microthrixaceae bacterium]
MVSGRRARADRASAPEAAVEPDDLVAVLDDAGRVQIAWGPLLGGIGSRTGALGLGPMDTYVHPEDTSVLRSALGAVTPGSLTGEESIRLRDLRQGWRRCTIAAIRVPLAERTLVSLRPEGSEVELFRRIAGSLARAVAEPPTGPTADHLDAVLLRVLPSLAASLDADATWAGLFYPDELVRWELQHWDDRVGLDPYASRVELLPTDDPATAALLRDSEYHSRPSATSPVESSRRQHSEGLRCCYETVAPLAGMFSLLVGVGTAGLGAWERRAQELAAALRLVAGACSIDMLAGAGQQSDLPLHLRAGGRLAPGRSGVLTTSIGQVVRPTDAFCDLVGRPGSELIGTEVVDLVAEADRARLLDAIDEACTKREGADELELRMASGSPGGPDERWLRVEVTALAGAEHRIPFAVIAASEITSAKGAVSRERELHRRYHSLLDAVPDPLFLLDSRGQVQYANDMAEVTFSEYLIGGVWELGALSAKILDSARPAGTSGPRLRFDAEIQFRHGRRHFEVSLVTDPGDSGASTVLAVLRDRTDSDETAAQLKHQGSHDALTQLPNRSSLMTSLRQALSSLDGSADGEIAVLVFDLDRFKLINDSLGHLAGDEVIVEAARRLGAALRPSDLLARMDGDEFAVLVRGVSDDRPLLSLVQRLQTELSSPPVMVEGRELVLSASVGVATTIDSEVTAEEMLRRADAAMDRAKHLGPGCADRYDETLQDEVQQRLEFNERLRLALAKRELRVFFQPDVELETGRILGAEALLRWQHPTLGLLSLGRFAQVAEDTEMMVGLGRWVLAQACTDALRWRRVLGGGFVLRVNMSARELQAPGLVDSVAEILGGLNYPPSALCIELTETALMGNAPSSAAVLDDLHALGVSLAIDDFGTGYSSLSYLKRFPVDVLKIDRQFVQGLPDGDDRAIIAAVMALADALGLEVSAEGVEEAVQRDILVTLGCVRGQGYLYSPPVPGEVFDGLAARATPLPLRPKPTPTWVDLTDGAGDRPNGARSGITGPGRGN